MDTLYCSSEVTGSAAQFNRSVSAMPPPPSTNFRDACASGHGEYTAFTIGRHSMNKRIPSDIGTIVGGGIAIAMLIALPAWTTTLFERLGTMVPEGSRFSVGSSIFIIVLLGGGRLAGYATGRFVAFMKRRA